MILGQSIEAGTLLDVLLRLDETIAVEVGTELTVTENQGPGITAVQVAEQPEQRGLLSGGTGIGRTTVGIETALVAHPDGVGVMVFAVGSYHSLVSPHVDAAITLHVVVVAYVFEATVVHVVVAALLRRVASVTPRGAAMNDD